MREIEAMTVAERHHPTKSAPESHERHVGRYERAVDLAGVTGGVWLDMACGYGYGTAIIAERAKADLVVGMDTDSDSTVYAAGVYHCLTTMFINGNSSEAAGWFPGRFDAVICIETLEHLAHDQQGGFLRDLRAVLSKGSPLVLMCPLGHGPNPDNPWHLHEPTEYELRTILFDAGLHIEKFEVMDYISTSGPATQATVLCR